MNALKIIKKGDAPIVFFDYLGYYSMLIITIIGLNFIVTRHYYCSSFHNKVKNYLNS